MVWTSGQSLLYKNLLSPIPRRGRVAALRPFVSWTIIIPFASAWLFRYRQSWCYLSPTSIPWHFQWMIFMNHCPPYHPIPRKPNVPSPYQRHCTLVFQVKGARSRYQLWWFCLFLYNYKLWTSNWPSKSLHLAKSQPHIDRRWFPAIMNDNLIQNEIHLKNVGPKFFKCTRMQSALTFSNFSHAWLLLPCCVCFELYCSFKLWYWYFA